MTGLSGTLGPYVANYFKQQNWNLVNWDHHSVSPEDGSACQQLWDEVKPDAVCHLAMGSESWAGWLASQCKNHSIPFLFTSTAMVFDSSKQGPYSIFSDRNSQEGYGQYKIRCEDAIWAANPDALIARLGWQIGDTRGGNNMFEQLCQQHEKQGHIDASSTWFPATSRMRDTAEMLFKLIQRNEAGLYHVDSNAQDKLSFYELVQKLAKFHQLNWTVKENRDFNYDQRLHDERIQTPALSQWLE